MKNAFGTASVLKFKAEKRAGKTVLRDLYFTAPFKIAKPFYKPNGCMKIMQLMASAGIMAGDELEISLESLPGTKTEFTSQSYEKIHRMEKGQAHRKTTVKVGEDSSMIYNPLPAIPFAQSAFFSETKINLIDETSKFIFCEILSGGRIASGEQFAYRYYHSLVEIKKAERLIFRDNTRFNGDQSMDAFGMMEGYTHLMNLLLLNVAKDEEWIARQRERLDSMDTVTGGVSRLLSGDIIIRILGNSSQELEKISSEIITNCEEKGEI